MLFDSHPLVKSIRDHPLRIQYNTLHDYKLNKFCGLVEHCTVFPEDCSYNNELYQLRKWITFNIALNLGLDSITTTQVKIRIATGMLNNISSLTDSEKNRVHETFTHSVQQAINEIVDEELPF